MLGKTGHGKSSTANTIIGKSCCKVSPGASSATKEIQVETTYIEGVRVNVIDTPGFVDTDDKKSQDRQRALETIQDIFDSVGNTIHLFVLVLKYPTKLTDEEGKVIDLFLSDDKIKRAMGPRMVVLFTNGDDFALDQRAIANPLTFNEWCRQQTNERMRKMLKELNYKTILFENKRGTEEDRKGYRMELFQLAKDVKHKVGPYTKKHYEDSKTFWENLCKWCCYWLS